MTPSDPSPQQAIANAAAFLRGGQDPDGLWRDFETLAGRSSEWVSGFVACCLGSSGLLSDEVRLAIRALLRRQRRSGGWGYNGRVPPDCDSTAWVLLAMTCSSIWKPSIVLNGLGYLMRHRSGEGFSTYDRNDGIEEFIHAAPQQTAGWRQAHRCVTAVAVCALAAHGLAREAAVTSAVRFLAKSQDRNGLWTSYWWDGPFYATAQVLRALAATRALTPRIWEDACAGLASLQDPSGGFGAGSPFATAMALVALTTWPGAEMDPALCRAGEWLARDQMGGRWPTQPILRIPVPGRLEPGDEQLPADRLGTGVNAMDRSGLFTAAAALWGLSELQRRYAGAGGRERLPTYRNCPGAGAIRPA